MHNDIYASFQDKISASIFNLHKYANYKTILQDQSSSNAKYAQLYVALLGDFHAASSRICCILRTWLPLTRPIYLLLTSSSTFNIPFLSSSTLTTYLILFNRSIDPSYSFWPQSRRNSQNNSANPRIKKAKLKKRRNKEIQFLLLGIFGQSRFRLNPSTRGRCESNSISSID